MMSAAVLKNYSIGTVDKVVLIDREANRVYKVECRGANYVLKIVRFVRAEHPDRPSLDVFDDYYFTTRALNNEMLYLERLNNYFERIDFTLNDKAIRVQQPVKNLSGSYVTPLNENEAAVLMTWLEGENAERHDFTVDDAALIGTLLAKLHDFRSDVIEHRIDYAERADYFLYRIRRSYDADIFDKRILKNASQSLIETRQRLKELDDDSEALIHGDFYTYNLIARDGIFVPIDFGYCSRGNIYQDIASICNEFDSAPDFKAAFIRSYESTRNISVKLRHVETFQAYLTLMYLAANSHIEGNYDWF